MTPEQIEMIRTRLDAEALAARVATTRALIAVADMRALLAEVERLRRVIDAAATRLEAEAGVRQRERGDRRLIDWLTDVAKDLRQ
jgi:hypothetical protein